MDNPVLILKALTIGEIAKLKSIADGVKYDNIDSNLLTYKLVSKEDCQITPLGVLVLMDANNPINTCACSRCELTKATIVEWVNKQGHNKCHYYPELFKELAVLFDVKVDLKPDMPRPEMEAGCTRFLDELYGQTAPSNSGSEGSPTAG